MTAVTTCAYSTPGAACGESIPQDSGQFCSSCDRWFCDEHLHVFDPVAALYRCPTCTERIGGAW